MGSKFSKVQHEQDEPDQFDRHFAQLETCARYVFVSSMFLMVLCPSWHCNVATSCMAMPCLSLKGCWFNGLGFGAVCSNSAVVTHRWATIPGVNFTTGSCSTGDLKSYFVFFVVVKNPEHRHVSLPASTRFQWFWAPPCSNRPHCWQRYVLASR